MEIPDDIVMSLAVLAKLPTPAFKATVNAAADKLLASGAGDNGDDFLGSKAVANVDPIQLKASFGAATVTFVEASKSNQTVEGLSSFLEELSLEEDKQKHFCAKFEENREKFRVLLRRTGFALPHVTDVDWKLEYYMKSNQLEKVNEPHFTLQFATEDNLGETDQVQLTCSLAQMQDLVSKLKDASKRLELLKETN